jgi:glutathionylspermidine synthase
MEPLMSDPTGKTSIRLVVLPAESRSQYRREVIFSCYKWDPQVGDTNTISDHAVILSSGTAAYLMRCAEVLAKETVAMEHELLSRPALRTALGFPRTIEKAFVGAGSKHRIDHPRIMRFDFHPTASRWAVSEVNSDVPGGFAEASFLPRLAAKFVPGTRAAGDPVAAVSQAFSRRISGGGTIALVHATSYADDRQVMRCLADGLKRTGFETILAAPDHLRWAAGGKVECIAEGRRGAVDGIVRFFPAEWMPLLPRNSGWQGYFTDSVPSGNHPSALLVQSKRLPLFWDRLSADTTCWRELLPETRSPSWAGVRHSGEWVFKPAFGRVGDGITIREAMSRKEYYMTKAAAIMSPKHWVMQRRFDSRPLDAADGTRHVCIGVFVVDGQFAGFYGRMSIRPRIDQYACDVPVLVEQTADEVKNES